MAKYIKFSCINTAAVSPLSPNQTYLVASDRIATVTASGLTGANAKTVIVGLNSSLAATAAISNPKQLLLTVSTNTGTATNPTIVSGVENPLVKAVHYAMTANPGGIVANANLGFDHAAVPVQMYWRTGTFS
jgi:hypothetical protein